MENDNKDLHNEVLAKQESTIEKKKCKCCGRELPLTSFHRQSKGYRKICISCERNKTGVTERFKDFTDRDLMEELRSRGYKGTFKRMRIEEFTL